MDFNPKEISVEMLKAKESPALEASWCLQEGNTARTLVIIVGEEGVPEGVSWGACDLPSKE